MDIQEFESRKRDHIKHALDPAHQAIGQSKLDQVHLIHEALPNLNLSDVSLASKCLGIKTKTPFYVAGMTAGHADAAELNRTLALACQARGWAMGVGSQRRDLENLNGGMLDRWSELREEVPQLVLFANIGITQLVKADPKKIANLVKSIRAQALIVHTNALQEAMQPEGTPHFKGGLSALKKICEKLSTPVVLKETGCGFSEHTLKKLAKIGLAGIDISGLGGTHWGRIEGARSAELSQFAQAALTFSNWGEPTVDSVIAAKRILKKTEIWASGGVRSGLDAAKLIALGAHRVGYAKPALEAALAGPDSLSRWMEIQEFELRVALFCTDSLNPAELRAKENAIRWKTNGN